MTNLRTHENRLKALEEAYDSATLSTDKAQIVLSAAQMERENFYVQRDTYAANMPMLAKQQDTN